MARQLRYFQVADGIRARLAAEEYRDGHPLPGEEMLARELGVSRATVRKALLRLKAEGLLDSRQGFGWYPTAPRLRHRLDTLTTLEAQIRRAGRQAGRRVLTFAFVPAPAPAADVLGVETVLETRRVSTIDGQPFALVTVWVPHDLAVDLSRRSVEEQPIYEQLPVRLAGASQVVTAVSADAEDAEVLELPAGAPLLRCERTTRADDGRAVLFSESVYNPLLTELAAETPAAAEPAGLRLILPPPPADPG